MTHAQTRQSPAISPGKPVAGGKLLGSQDRGKDFSILSFEHVLATNVATCFVGDGLFHWLIFKGLSAKYSMLIITFYYGFVRQSFFQTKTMLFCDGDPSLYSEACSLYSHLSLKRPLVVLVSGNALCGLPILTHRLLNQWVWEVKPNRNPTFKSSSSTGLQTEAVGAFTLLSFSISPHFSGVDFSKRSWIQKAMCNFPYCPASRTLILCGLNTLVDLEGNSPLPPTPPSGDAAVSPTEFSCLESTFYLAAQSPVLFKNYASISK